MQTPASEIRGPVRGHAKGQETGRIELVRVRTDAPGGLRDATRDRDMPRRRQRINSKNEDTEIRMDERAEFAIGLAICWKQRKR